MIKQFGGVPAHTMDFVTARKVPMRLRIVYKGDLYGGPGPSWLKHEFEEPLVEFYDRRYAMPSHTKDGQFITRYELTTLRGAHPLLRDSGIDLQGGVPDWVVDAPTLRMLHDLLLNHI